MDKQTNIHTNAQGFIPVNTRTIGAPEGIYILYLEDYVHTFMKKLLSNTPQNVSLKGRKRLGESQDYQQDCQIESTVQQEIALYGRSIEENGRYRIVISGAAVSDGGSDRIQQLNNTYFPSCSYIGNANVSLNKDSRLRLELTLRSTRVILDDFYIYYDQNEEMQNYLVEWNTTRENDTGSVILSPTEQDTRARNSVGDAAQLSRITQAYNREEAKVSFMWNVMNVLPWICRVCHGVRYHFHEQLQQNAEHAGQYRLLHGVYRGEHLLSAACIGHRCRPVTARFRDAAGCAGRKRDRKAICAAGKGAVRRNSAAGAAHSGSRTVRFRTRTACTRTV